MNGKVKRTARKALGRGLSALISTPAAPVQFEEEQELEESTELAEKQASEHKSMAAKDTQIAASVEGNQHSTKTNPSEMPGEYESLLKQSLSKVAARKIGNSSDVISKMGNSNSSLGNTSLEKKNNTESDISGYSASTIDEPTENKVRQEKPRQSKQLYLSIDEIVANPNQPRSEFKEQALQELADSIKAIGIIQPILLRPGKGENEKYEIVAGERRWRAAKLAGVTQIPVIIRDLDKRQVLETALVENIQRSNLNPIEEALAYQNLIDEFNLSQQALAERVGKERSSVSNFLRLLRLPGEVQELLKKKEISMGHAKAILTVKEPSAQRNLAQKVIKEELSVRALEEIVARVVVLESPKKKKAKAKGAFPEVCDRLRTRLGTKVSIRHKASGKGKIEIEYFSEQELDRLTELLSS